MNEVETEDSLHDQMQELIAETGELLGKISEKNYPLLYSGYRRLVDVVWKINEESAPVCAFEIVVKGDLDRAITILRQAFLMWNSKPFLVTVDDEKAIKANRLLENSSPELKGLLKLVNRKGVLEGFQQAKGLESLAKSFDFKIVLRLRKAKFSKRADN